MTGITGRVAPGVRIGDYVLERELPARTDRQVFAAAHVLLPRRARFVTAAAGEAAAELMREACIVEALRHPAVPRVFECGLLPDRRPWLALEPADGPTIAELVLDEPFAPAELVTLVRDVAGVLEHAHARDVVHRKLDLDVIVRTPDGIRIADWSSAATTGDRKCDIEALGTLAYLALARARPTIPAARRCPGAPARLTSLIDRMLGPTPPTAGDVRAEAAVLADQVEPVMVEDDGTAIEEVSVVLVDISREPPPLPRLRKLEWTPAGGYAPLAKVQPRKKWP
jgi:serine/threonine protein kinase